MISNWKSTTSEQTIFSNVANNIKDTASADQLKKITVSIVYVITESIRKELFEIDQLFEVDETKQKRALEILGDFLSTCTRVPLAREHRRLMEQINMLEMDSQTLSDLMKAENSQQEKVIQAMQLHEVQIEHADNLGKINSITQANPKSIVLAATASITLKSSEMITMADKALDCANDILSKSYSNY